MKIDGYTLRSGYNGGTGNWNLKSWVIEVRNDDQDTWEVIDSKQNNYDLDGADRTRYYPARSTTAVRYVRLRQTGPNHHENYHIWLSGWELFGSLIA